MTFLLLLLVFSARLSLVHGQSGLAEEESDISDVQVKRCCGEGQRLDSSDVNTPQCVPHSPNLPDEIITVEGLDLTKEPSSRKVDLTVSFEAGGSRMPTCKSSRVFSVLEQDSWLTKKGKLVQDYQGHQMRHEEFCVDYVAGDRFGAVSCDACTKDHPCVNLCCPHGKAFVEDTELGEICGTETVAGDAFSPEFWNKHDVQMEEYWEEQGIILKAPKYSSFNCPKPFIQDPLHRYEDWNADRYTILPDGRLRGENITYMHQKQALEGNFTWDNDKFCVSYADLVFEDYDYDGVFDLTYHICYDDNLPESDQVHKNFLSVFNPVALCISIFFLLLTMAVFVWYKNIKWDRSNMMKMAFMVNLTIAYIISVAVWLQDESVHGSLGCKAAGYLLQHFFLSAMFWINAMGVHVWRMFKVGGVRRTFREDLQKFGYYALYAQGAPLLINIVTAIVDSTKEERGQGEGLRITKYYPNMGELTCYLGENKDEDLSYFGTSKFIYSHLFMMLVQVVNAGFMISIGMVLHKGWENQAKRLEMMGDNQESFMERFNKIANKATIVLRLFVILGLPWVFELISEMLSHKYGDVQTKPGVRETIFLTNLFTCFAGFCIFVTLVCKRDIITGVRDQMTESLAGYGVITKSSDSSMAMTSMTAVSSEART